jgi:hypothetical protein
LVRDINQNNAWTILPRIQQSIETTQLAVCSDGAAVGCKRRVRQTHPEDGPGWRKIDDLHHTGQITPASLPFEADEALRSCTGHVNDCAVIVRRLIKPICHRNTKRIGRRLACV